MASTSRSVRKRKHVDISTITENSECTFNVEGIYDDDVNWIDGTKTPGNMRIVDEKLYRQGNNGSCWAWGSVKLSEASRRRAGREPLEFSVQHFLDNVYPPGLIKTGHVQAGLQWAKEEGAMTKQVYETGKKRKYSGNQPEGQRPPQPEGERYRIGNWFPLDDDEETILAALKKTVICVCLTCFSAFLDLKGRGLLDMHEAENTHKPRRAILHGGTNPIGHTVLLVGAGTFRPTKPGFQHLTMRYWIIKNTWEKWGFEGLGYLLRHSSLLEIHARKAGLAALSESDKSEVLRTVLLPLYATVSVAPGAPELVMDTYVSRVQRTGFSVADLVDWVTTTYVNHLLIYLFYKPSTCEIDADELFTAVAKSYHLDPLVKLALINLDSEDYRQSFERFGFAGNEDLVLLLYKPQKKRARNTSSFHKFTRNFTLGEILYLLGHEMMAGAPPS